MTLTQLLLVIHVVNQSCTNECPVSIHSFIHSFITIGRAHYAENVESEALDAVARWSVIGKVVSF